MRLSTIVCPLLLTTALGASAPAAADVPPPTQPDRSSAVSADAVAANAFTFDAYRQLGGAKGNFFFSGTSLREALGIAYLGARGATATEMANTLHLDADPTKAAAAAKSEIAELIGARGSAELSIANRLWTDRGYALRPEFAKNALDAFGAPVDPVDFRGDPEGARKIIDAWVAKQTKDKIPELLPQGSVDRSTRAVITNAVYFKADWQTQFAKEQTYDEPFHVDASTAHKTPMMHATASFALGAMDGAQVLEMPYANGDLAMDVVLPNTADGLPALEAKLSASAFDQATSHMTPRRVAVTMPKLKLSWHKSLVPPLRALGMHHAFDAADFSGMGEGLAISDVIHETFLAVDEKGTEAAAATAVVMRETAVSIEPPSVPFKADHPFVVVLRDKKHGRILFMGRIADAKV